MKTLTIRKSFYAMALCVVFVFTTFLIPIQNVDAASQTPITRSQVETRALSMINYKWSYSAAKNGVIDPKYASLITKPDQLANASTVQATGIPYNWGGIDSQYSTSMNVPWTSFADAINKGAYAGNVNTETGLGYVPGTAGIDCSGFVQAAFNIRDYKISTTTMFNTYFKKIAVSDLKHMDILNKSGYHVVIFDRWGTWNGIKGAYTYESTPFQERGGIQGTKKYFMSMEELNDGYVAGRYINIIDDAASTTLPHPVNEGSFAKVANVVYAASLRATPADNSVQIGVVPKSTVAYLIDYSNGWYQVKYNGQVGWIWGDFVTSIPSGKYVAFNGYNYLNIRTNPSTSAAIAGTLARNQYAEKIGYSADGLWYKISINGVQGWAYKAYLSYIY